MSPEMILRGLLLGVVLPGGLALAILLATVRPWRAAIPASARFASAPAVALAFVAADFALAPQRPFPPVEAWQWLSALALGAVLLASVEVWRGRTGVVGWLLRAVLLGAAVWIMVAPLREYEWAGANVYLWPAGTLLALLLGWAALQGWLRACGPREHILWLLVLLALSSVLLVLSGSKRLGDLGGALTAAVGAGCVVSLWRPAAPLAAGARAVACAVLCGLFVNGWFFAEMPPASLALVGAGLVAPLVMRLGALRRWSGAQALLLRGSLLIVPLGAAVALAARAYFADSGDYGY